jgi:cytochrome b6-f complex iron-sulfur subunit
VISRRSLVTGSCACAALVACGKRLADQAGPTDTAAGDGGGTGDTGFNGGTDTSGTDGGSETGGADTSVTDTCADTGASVDGWVEVPLADYPDLLEVGGFAYVELPEQLLHLIVAQPEADCFIALWRICTHGACETEWDRKTIQAVCPCHGSVFADDGAVLVGPATSGLRSYPIVRRGDSLWLQR